MATWIRATPQKYNQKINQNQTQKTNQKQNKTQIQKCKKRLKTTSLLLTANDSCTASVSTSAPSLSNLPSVTEYIYNNNVFRNIPPLVKIIFNFRLSAPEILISKIRKHLQLYPQEINATFTSNATHSGMFKSGYTTLMLAARFGLLDLLEFLISQNANLHAQDEDGWTALMLSIDSVVNMKSSITVLENCYKCIKSLIYSEQQMPYTRKSTPTYFEENHQILHAINNRGWTPLIVACHYYDANDTLVKVIKLLLLGDKKSYVNIEDYQGWNALHHIVSYICPYYDSTNTEIIIAMLLKAGIDISTPDDTGRSPLKMAIDNGGQPAVGNCIKILIS